MAQVERVPDVGSDDGPPLRIAVLGPGAVGGLVAALLARTGDAVTCLAATDTVNGRHPYLEIMMPGFVVGAIIGRLFRAAGNRRGRDVIVRPPPAARRAQRGVRHCMKFRTS